MITKFFYSILVLVVCLTLNVNADDFITYQSAYKKLQDDGKPMLVIVTASWCQACRDIHDRLEVIGLPSHISGAYVDIDKDPITAKAVLAGVKNIPRVVLYYKQPDGVFKMLQVTGVPSNKQLKAMINDPRIPKPADTEAGQTSTYR